MKSPILLALTAIFIMAPGEIRGQAATPSISGQAANAAPAPRTGFRAAGLDFAWIESDGAGFWITKDEIASVTSLPSAEALRKHLEEHGIPATWAIGLPSAGQWRNAHDQAQALGLVNFMGGLGEFLADGKIVGVSTHTRSEKAKSPLSLAERRELTLRMISPGKAANPGASPANPPIYDHTEKAFAYRIVIAPEHLNKDQPIGIPGQDLATGSLRLAWIEEGAFWISADEIGPVASLPSAENLKAYLTELNLPEDWEVGVPTLNQWQAAREQSAAAELVRLDSGLAEFLKDGRVIGSSDFSKAKSANDPLTVEERRAKTRKLVRPGQFPGIGEPVPGGAGGLEVQVENEFAFRIVVVPFGLNPMEEIEVAPEPDVKGPHVPGMDFNIAGHHFAWIASDDEGFWITKDEIRPVAAAPAKEGLIKQLEDQGIPATWKVALPTADQWRKAHDEAHALGLLDFGGGLGEFLEDGTIVGISKFTQDPKARNPLILKDRQKLTERIVPGRAANPGGGGGVPPTFGSTEKEFAYRIVIVP